VKAAGDSFGAGPVAPLTLLHERRQFRFGEASRKAGAQDISAALDEPPRDPCGNPGHS
jgi:hypothetical protein